MYRWECRPDRRRPTRTTVLGAPRPGAARGPRCRAMRYHHAADSYVYTNHAPWHVSRRGTLVRALGLPRARRRHWRCNETHGLTLRVCPSPARERTPATTFTQRTPSPHRHPTNQFDSTIDSSTRTRSQMRTRPFRQGPRSNVASEPVVPSSELHLNWSTRPHQGPNRTM